MATLLFCSVAPLQSWGIQSAFSIRDTGREPSKSGVIGLLGSALGCQREDTTTIARLASLKMGVRADREGGILRDYHTAGKGGYLDTDGKSIKKSTILSNRYYLTDAAFLIGVESPDLNWLTILSHALYSPHWMLFLGRKACIPSQPVWLQDGLFPHHTLDQALADYPWLGKNFEEYQRLSPLRLVYDDPENGTEIRQDHPLSFAKSNRQFIPRRLKTVFLEQNPPFRANDF